MDLPHVDGSKSVDLELLDQRNSSRWFNQNKTSFNKIIAPERKFNGLN